MPEKVDTFECVVFDRGQYKAVFNTAVDMNANPSTRSPEATGELQLGPNQYARTEEHLVGSVALKERQIKGQADGMGFSRERNQAQHDELAKGLDEVRKANSNAEVKFCPMS